MSILLPIVYKYIYIYIYIYIFIYTFIYINRIQDLSDLPESSVLVSFDVVGLYPHIPHEEGIKTIAEYLETREDKTVSTKSLCDLARLF